MPATTPSITGIKATSLAQHIRAPSGAHHTRRPVGSKITRQNISTERKQAIATQFFESPYFALAGASQLRTEQGYKSAQSFIKSGHAVKADDCSIQLVSCSRTPRHGFES